MKRKKFLETEYLKTQPSHLQDRLRRKVAKKKKGKKRGQWRIRCRTYWEKTNASKRFKKTIGKKMVSSNSKTILSNLDFDPKNYVDEDLLFDFKQTRQEKIIDRMTEKLSDDNDNLHIEHRKTLFNKILRNLDKKILKSKDETRVSQLRRIKNQSKWDYDKLGEAYVETDMDRNELLKVVLALEHKIIKSTDASRISQLKWMMRIWWEVGENYKWGKKNVRSLQTVSESVVYQRTNKQ